MSIDSGDNVDHRQNYVTLKDAKIPQGDSALYSAQGENSIATTMLDGRRSRCKEAQESLCQGGLLILAFLVRLY
ncbi:hypothetical protein Trco_007048 [Trichoderma cornu-damae]|uniref:Uncharacterized protein n=1 Tax=Trichoderma cornu-damae TaxID=654480 RepID=A0A9P8QHR6_9HYPO|nr:hypothetical protein Trco_007048 [Trichoderma cornu-damae]